MDPRRRIEADLRQWLRNHHGVIGWREACVLGATRRMVQAKVDRGEWERLFRGVYRHTAAPRSPIQEHRAALVVTDGAGAISHRSGAWVWGYLPTAPERPELSLRRDGNRGRRYPGIVVHRMSDFDLSQAVTRKGLLVTNPLRTLVDFASQATPHDLTLAVDAALSSKAVIAEGLRAEVDRLSRMGRDGIGAMRRHLLQRGFVGAPHPSVLESKMRRIVQAVRHPALTQPRVEVVAGDHDQYRLDVAWPAVLFGVEVDGYAFHSSPEQMEHDQARRNRLLRDGWTILVYSWRAVGREPTRICREIEAGYQHCLDRALGPRLIAYPT